MSWLGGVGLELTGAGGVAEGCVPVCWPGPGTVPWLVGAALVGASACTVRVSLDGRDVSCAGVDAGAWPVGVGLVLTGVGEAAGAGPTACCSEAGGEL
jgi:hypothetical protein